MLSTYKTWIHEEGFTPSIAMVPNSCSPPESSITISPVRYSIDNYKNKLNLSPKTPIQPQNPQIYPKTNP